MELSRTAAVILGMLNLGLRTGYEIKSTVDHSTRFFWAASYGQIYPELARLEEAGLVRSERVEGDARGSKAYELTPDGERALRDWLSSEEPLHHELRHEGLLKLFFFNAIEPEQRLRQLRLMRSEHERVLGELRQVERTLAEKDDPGFPAEVLQMGLEYQAFVIDWCARLERRLAKEAKAAETATRAKGR